MIHLYRCYSERQCYTLNNWCQLNTNICVNDFCKRHGFKKTHIFHHIYIYIFWLYGFRKLCKLCKVFRIQDSRFWGNILEPKLWLTSRNPTFKGLDSRTFPTILNLESRNNMCKFWGCACTPFGLRYVCMQYVYIYIYTCGTPAIPLQKEWPHFVPQNVQNSLQIPLKSAKR